jgi:CRISPR-associated protein Cas1
VCRQTNPAGSADAEENEPLTLPVEDLSTIILESPQIRITSALLGYLQSHNVVVMTCDQSHMPNGLLMPFHQHSRYAQVAHLQTQWTAPFKKRCWQRLMQRKIRNQAACLRACGQPGDEEIEAIAENVLSGDTSNREGLAARRYWIALFGRGFQRFGNQTWIPSALNYGYAVLRACMARAVVAAGLLPCLGIQHKSELNAFNLVDDLLEPFRPLVDEEVYAMRIRAYRNDPNPDLPGAVRHRLAAFGGVSCRIEDHQYSVQNACEVVSDSLVQAIRQKEPKLLKMPEF